MQAHIQCSHCGSVVTVQPGEDFNNDEITREGSSDSRLEGRIPGANQVISMEHARVRLARHKTVAIETVLNREYLEELVKWMEEARAGRASSRNTDE